MNSSGSSLPVAALIVIAVLSLLLALALSAIETAMSRLSRASVEDLVEDGRPRADVLIEVIQHRRRADLSLRGIRTFAQVILAVALTLVLANTALPWWAVALVSLTVCSFLQFIAVSLIAMRWGGRNPENVALWGAKWTRRLLQASYILNPVITALRDWFPQPNRTEAEARAEMAEDLREMVDQVGETELLDHEDRQMLRSVFELGHTLVREVMVPRTDMITADHDLEAQKALRLFVRSGYSRIPVVGDDVDDVRGILYFKDIVQRMEAAEGALELVAEQMMRPAEFTIETKAADDLLRLMQAEHFHMALVVDEYGGISGLVTMEDLLEEVVGELTDEHDRHVVEAQQLDENTWRIPSRMGLNEVGELFGIDIEDDDVDSIGGLLTKAIGKVPLSGAVGQMNGLHMVAEEAHGRRRQVSTILVSLQADDTETKESEDPADSATEAGKHEG